MLRSLCLSSTSVLVLLAAGCSDDAACEPGPTGVADTGLTASAEGTTITFGPVASGANNDCPVDGTPAGVISVTLGGSQAAPAGVGVISFCLPRPDLVDGGGEFPLDPDRHPALADDRVHVIDLDATVDADCTWHHDPEDPPSGTATFTGFCADGTDPAGYGLVLDGELTVTETCAGMPDREVTVTLGGSIAVTADL